MVNLKQLATAGLAVLSLLVLAFPGYAQEEHTSMLTDNIYSYAPGDGYASMFVVTTDGVIAIESVNSKHATGMVESIKSVTDKPIRYLLQSHNHWDHSSGGQVFRNAGAKILAHKEAYVWMEANTNADMVLPDEAWDGKRKDITLGDTTIEMHYIGMSHGLGMTVFRVSKQKIAYIADVVTPKRVLFTIVPDFNINEWKRALLQIETLDFDKALFSHDGNAGYTGSKADVVESREFIQDLQGAIVAEFQKGKNFTEIPQLVKLPKYESWAMYDEWLAMNVWRVMLDMYMGPFPWRPAFDFEN